LKRVFVICFSLLVLAANAQDDYDKVYEISSDESSFSTGYEGVFDSLGFYWVGTNNGVYRYSGYRYFEKTYEDTLKGKSVYGMNIDHYGTIWFINTLGHLYYLKNNIPTQYTLPHHEAVNAKIFQPNRKHLVVYTSKNIYEINLKTYEIRSIVSFSQVRLNRPNAYYNKFMDNVLYSCYNSEHLVDLIDLDTETTRKNLYPRIVKHMSNSRPKLKGQKDLHFNFLLSYTGPLIFIENSDFREMLCFDTTADEFIDYTTDRPINKKIRTINVIDEDRFAINTTVGAHIFNKETKSAVFVDETEGKAINNILIRNGQLWCTTATDGIILYNQAGTKLLNTESSHLLKITKNEDLITARRGKVSVFRNNRLIRELELTNNSSTYSISEGKDDILLHNGYDGTIHLSKKNYDILATKPHHALMKFKIRNDEYILDYTGMTVNNKNINTTRYNFYEISNDSSQIFLANNNGIDVLDVKTKTIRNLDSECICQGLKFDHKKRLWAGCASGGGLRVYMHGERLFNFPNEFLFKEKSCRTILSDTNRLWVATDKGLIRFDPDSDFKEIYSKADGLLNTDITTIAQSDTYLYISTKKGLFFLDKTDNSLDNISPPDCHIQSIKIWENEQPIKDNLSLAHDENNLFIEFLSNAYNIMGDYEYYYRMVGIDSSWNSTPSDINYARFPQLSPGEYTFEVFSSLDNNRVKSEIKRIQFDIDSPLQEKLWFQMLSLLLVFFILYQIVVYIQKQKLSRVKQNLEAEKMRSLLQQMNPHFIYNTLNSIQYFIFNDKRFEAGKYLSIFSDLMRRNFEFSESEYIPLKDEIEHIQNYLEMEKIRFEEQLDIQFDIQEGLDVASIQIPPFLLQPILENAIKHGLRGTENNRILNTKIYRTDNILNVDISDNGIGRMAADKRKKKSERIYTSNLNIKKRIELLNRLDKNKNKPISFEIDDLYDNKETPEGTKVKFKFPIQ